MNENHTDSACVRDAQCTCEQRGHDVDVGDWPTTWDPTCPRHGLDTQLKLADQNLDIDTSYLEEE